MSDEETIIAKPLSTKTICCNTQLVIGEYKVEWNPKSAVCRLSSRENIEHFCKKASEHCDEAMIKVISTQASNTRGLFFVGMTMSLLFCTMIIYTGIAYNMPWISVISVLVFVFSIGFLYELINTRVRRIYEKLKEFIENNDDFENKGIEVRPGPYGAYIEFSVIRAKAV